MNRARYRVALEDFSFGPASVNVPPAHIRTGLVLPSRAFAVLAHPDRFRELTDEDTVYRATIDFQGWSGGALLRLERGSYVTAAHPLARSRRLQAFELVA